MEPNGTDGIYWNQLESDRTCWPFELFTLIACFRCFDVCTTNFFSLFGLSESAYKATLPYFLFFFLFLFSPCFIFSSLAT